tara:strand:+ start:1477 stop:1734 length:258 start_codon:yes stop_codon:yes gene_type:complete
MRTGTRSGTSTCTSTSPGFPGLFYFPEMYIIKELQQAHAQAQAQDPGSMVDGPRTMVRPKRSQTQDQAQALRNKNKWLSLRRPLP